MEKERGEDQQNFWISPKGVDRLSTASTVHPAVGLADGLYVHPAGSRQHATTSTAVTRWPRKGVAGEPAPHQGLRTAKATSGALGVLPAPWSAHLDGTGLSGGEVRASDLSQHPLREAAAAEPADDQVGEELSGYKRLQTSCTCAAASVPWPGGGDSLFLLPTWPGPVSTPPGLERGPLPGAEKETPPPLLLQGRSRFTWVDRTVSGEGGVPHP